MCIHIGFELFGNFKEIYIYLVARFGLRLLPKLFGNFGDFANRRTQKSRVCVSDTQALQASKVVILFYREFFVTGALPKSSKYITVNLGLDRRILDDLC